MPLQFLPMLKHRVSLEVFYDMFESLKKVKIHCKYCGRLIIKLDSDWAKMGECIYCWDGENRGREEFKVKVKENEMDD